MQKIINTRKKVVHGVGPKDADIMIIGEAPGKNEAKEGKPFVGRAGQLLDKLLAKNGLLRSHCYITNVIKEQPYKNNIKPFINLSNKYPQVSEQSEKYIDYLWEEIEEVDPNLIIAAGNIPLYVLTGEKGSTKWRGSILQAKSGHKVIPIIHPASALRQFIWRHFITFDLKRAKKESKFPEIRRKKRNYIIEPSMLEIRSFLDECLNRDLVAFDIEVGHGEVSCISFAYNSEEAISIPFMKRGVEYMMPDQEYEVWTKIGQILEDPNITKVAQNTTFDASFLFRKYGIKPVNLHDTMIMCAILYPDFPKGLDFITSIYTDMPYYKDERKESFNKGSVTDDEKFWIYNAKDSIVLMEALPKMMDELERQGNMETYEHQRRLLQPLLFMTEHGIKMDTEAMEKKSKELEEELAEIEQELNELVGYEINPRSPQQLMDYFYGDKEEGGLGIKPYKNNGRPTTDEGALIRLKRGTKNRDPIPEAGLVLRSRSLTKLKGTYIDMNLDEDGRVRTSMNPVGTRTGRLSSSKTIFGTGANLQNQPPMMKKFMMADKNHVAYEIDLGQAENRVVAYISPEPKMIEAFESGIDIHSRTASYIFNIPEGEIKQMAEEGVKCEGIGTGDYSHRFWGKKANHAFNYGQGYRKFSYQVEIPEAEGKMIHQKYHTAYPGIRKYHNWVKEKLRKDRTIENLFGRKYMFLDRWSHHLFEAAYAFIPQSTVADIINRWGLLEIYGKQDKYGEVKLLNQIHDSIVIEIPLQVPLERHSEIILDICASLEREMTFRGRTFSIPCDLNILPKNLKDGHEVDNVSQLSMDELKTIIKDEVYRGKNT